jgi:hypothetical protein
LNDTVNFFELVQLLRNFLGKKTLPYLFGQAVNAACYIHIIEIVKRTEKTNKADKKSDDEIGDVHHETTDLKNDYKRETTDYGGDKSQLKYLSLYFRIFFQLNKSKK